MKPGLFEKSAAKDLKTNKNRVRIFRFPLYIAVTLVLTFQFTNTSPTSFVAILTIALQAMYWLFIVVIVFLSLDSLHTSFTQFRAYWRLINDRKTFFNNLRITRAAEHLRHTETLPGKKKERNRILVPLAIVLASIAVYAIFKINIALATFLFGLQIYVYTETFYIPPAILYLSTSKGKDIASITSFGSFIFPLKLLSLIQTENTTLQTLSSVAKRYTFRTQSDDNWKECAELLMKVCSIIVIDTRHVSEPILHEILRATSESNDASIVFLGNPNNHFPALDELVNRGEEIDLHRTALVDELQLTLIVVFFFVSRKLPEGAIKLVSDA
jgi:hypothetical protein